MKNLERTLKFEDVPSSWALCFIDGCAMADKCMRRAAYEVAPARLTTAKTVLPNKTESGDCKWFAPIETMRMAAGFSHIYDNVMRRDYKSMKQELTNYLGGRSNYYRYKKGTRLLSPSQQERIGRIMKRYGCAEGFDYDGYTDRYCFPTQYD